MGFTDHKRPITHLTPCPIPAPRDRGRAAARPQAAPSIIVPPITPTVTVTPVAPSVTIFLSTNIETIHPSTPPSHITSGYCSHIATPSSVDAGPSPPPPTPTPVVYAPHAETFSSPIAHLSVAAFSPLLQILHISQVAPGQNLSIQSLIPVLQESFLGLLNDSIRSANENRVSCIAFLESLLYLIDPLLPLLILQTHLSSPHPLVVNVRIISKILR